MLWPAWMAAMASSRTGAGVGVSQTPCARLMPPMRAHSVVMARISDCRAPGASSLSVRRDGAATEGVLGIGGPRLDSILHNVVLAGCSQSPRARYLSLPYRPGN